MKLKRQTLDDYRWIGYLGKVMNMVLHRYVIHLRHTPGHQLDVAKKDSFLKWFLKHRSGLEDECFRSYAAEIKTESLLDLFFGDPDEKDVKQYKFS